MANLSTALTVLKDRLRQFSNEAERMTAICNPENLISTDRHLTAFAIGTHDNPRTLRPKLPVEIIDTVFSFAPRTTLQSLLVTNSFISTLAIRYLYREVVLTRPPFIVEFLRRVVSDKRLAMLVRSLDLNLTKPKRDDPTTFGGFSARPVPTTNFYQLLHRALLLMPGLVSITFELPRSDDPLWIFTGCKFRLRQLTTSMFCRRPLARFLETQHDIVDLTLRGYQTGSMMLLPFISDSPDVATLPAKQKFILSPTALPHLRSFNAVHADADLVRMVVAGRPVEIVSIPLFPDRSIPTLDALMQSTLPLRRLSIISFDPAAPTFLFEAVAKRFPDLQALHLVMLMAEYDQALLEESGPYLTNFNSLRYITFMAAPATPQTTPPPSAANAAPASAPTLTGTAASTLQTLQNACETIAGNAPLSDLDTDEADIARQWHKACPTLRTIILPQGRVWFQMHRESDGTTCAGAECPCEDRRALRSKNIRERRASRSRSGVGSTSTAGPSTSEASRETGQGPDMHLDWTAL